MDTIILTVCYLVTGIVELYIMLQFMDARYHRTYQKKWIYVMSCIVIPALMSGVNLIGNPNLNFLSWIIVTGIYTKIFYFENGTKDMKRILECEAVLFVMALAETLVVMTVRWLVAILKLPVPDAMLPCYEGMCFAIVLVCFFYPILKRLVKTKNTVKSTGQPVFFFVILLYGFLHMMEMGAIIVANIMDDLLIMLNMGLTVFISLFLLTYIKKADEKKQYDEEMAMLKQQARLQYEYYLQQEQKYNETIRILHDVNKHIQMLGGLCVSENEEEAKRYAAQIRETLNPLIPAKYTGNAILDILLSDKLREAKNKGIEMELRLGGVSFDFMEAIDITTIFGNLLDNALEACEKVQDKAARRIRLSAERVREMVAVSLENGSDSVTWKGELPVSEKGEQRGIGLLNVRKSIDKYDGNITFREEQGKFITEFFLNG